MIDALRQPPALDIGRPTCYTTPFFLTAIGGLRGSENHRHSGHAHDAPCHVLWCRTPDEQYRPGRPLARPVREMGMAFRLDGSRRPAAYRVPRDREYRRQGMTPLSWRNRETKTRLRKLLKRVLLFLICSLPFNCSPLCSHNSNICNTIHF